MDTENIRETERLEQLYKEYCELDWNSKFSRNSQVLNFADFRGIELLIYQRRGRSGEHTYGIGIDRYDYSDKDLGPFTAPPNGKGFIWKCENRDIYEKREARQLLFLLLEVLGLTDRMVPTV